MLLPVMMTQPCAVPELLQDIICDCKDGACEQQCTYQQHEQLSTAQCESQAELFALDDDNILQLVQMQSNLKPLEVFCFDVFSDTNESDTDSEPDSN